MLIKVHTDGGARGNPGPAAVGVVIEEVKNEIRTIARFGKRIGEATNNAAEYKAVLEALQNLKSQISNRKLEDKEELQIQFFLDSNLVVNQLNGRFKVKDPELRELLTKIRILEQEVGGNIRYNLIPREQNRRADFLVNHALDNQ
ncbi:MAG: ribonuclease HI family protein [Patescibacteria group bacterium]